MKKIIVLMTSFLVASVSMAAETSLYDFSWLDKDKEIYVLQNRKFRKNGKAYVGALGNWTLSGPFIDQYGGSARAGYFFQEDWGIEFAYGKNTGSENTTAKAVREQSARPYYRRIDSYVGAMAMWSPFYSKINTFNKIFYFDWLFGLGAANITTLDNRNFFDISNPANWEKLTSQNHLGVLWSTALRFYINEQWSVRLDFTGVNYRAEMARGTASSTGATSAPTKIFGNYDLGVGLNYTF
jgi:outer membrane beta-barrel protein